MENKIKELESKTAYLQALKNKEDNIDLIVSNTDIDKSRLEVLPASKIADYAISLLSYGFLNLDDQPEMTVSLI